MQTSPAAGRAETYDRNPTNVNQDFTTTANTQAGPITRFTYTVPAGRKAWLMSTYAHALRSTAAGSNGTGRATINHQAPAVKAIVTQATVFLLAIGTFAAMNGGQAGVLLASEILNGITADPSTTPSNDYELHARLIEFDA